MEVEAGQVALNAGDASLWHLFWQASPLVKVAMSAIPTPLSQAAKGVT